MTSDSSVDHCFLRKFASVSKELASRPAIIVDGIERLNYAQLAAKSDQVANVIAPFLRGAEPIVGLQLSKSAHYIVALIGVWKAGAAWLPLDPSMPASQRSYMVDDCDVQLVISEDEEHPALCPSVQIGQLMEGRLVTGQQTRRDSICSADQLAYVIYTSGTTGRPRGVAVQHSGIVNLIDNQRLAFGITPHSRCLWYYSTCFDASISDIGTALLSGAALCIESEFQQHTSEMILDMIQSRGITHADIPPSLLAVLPVERAPSCLQTVIIGGQACDVDTVRRWSTKVRLVNVYGPTEATVCSSLCRCDAGWERPLIGQPLSDTEYLVFDGSNNPIAAEEYGELLIGGVGVARGYVNQPDATAQKFIWINGRRFYRSGDYIRLDRDGEFVFAGRIDRQINHNGLRIEPEEIEAVVLSIPDVNGAAVLQRKIHESALRDSLVLFVETAGNRISESEITDLMHRQLPKYRVCPVVRQVAKLPRLHSGKCDYAALAAMPLFTPSQPHAVSITTAEQDILQILREVLRIDWMSADDDFFAFGGDSLAVIQVSALAAARGITLPGWIVSSCRTARGISRELSMNQPSVAGYRCSAKWLRNEAESLVAEAGLEMRESDAGRTKFLLTGATGFLGCRIMEQLLRNTPQHVICIVRGGCVDAARERLYQHLRQQEVSLTHEQSQRIHVAVGDLSQPLMGLSLQEYTELADSVGHVVHCAAAVDSVGSYQVLRAANLMATFEVLKFVAASGVSRLDYISTLSVFAGTDCTGRHLETSVLRETEWVFGGYAQTKWASEILVQEFVRRFPDLGRRIAVYRLGLLTADTRTGVAAAQDVLTLTVRGLQNLKCVPDPLPDIRFDMTPVNYAAQSIAVISRSPSACHAGNAWHIAGRESVSAARLFQFLRSRGLVLEPVSHERFLQHVDQSSGDPWTSMACLSLARWLPGFQGDHFRASDLFQATDRMFDSRCTQELLSEYHLRCPLPDDVMMTKSLDRIIRNAEFPRRLTPLIQQQASYD